MTDNKNIEDLRIEIDNIDNSLLELFNARARAAIKVGGKKTFSYAPRHQRLRAADAGESLGPWTTTHDFGCYLQKSNLY